MEPKQYRGRLTPQQVADGINAASANARRLLDDARLLLDNGRYPSAASLAILAIEEGGKANVLRSLLIANDEGELKEHWKHYRRHTEKNHFLIMWDMAKAGARTMADFRDLFTDQTLDARRAFDVVKQIGFYTDCYGDGHWAEPGTVIDKGFAELMVKIASVVTIRSHEVSVQEMVLWQTHMQNGLTKVNLRGWSEAVEEAGLYESGYAREMARWIGAETQDDLESDDDA